MSKNQSKIEKVKNFLATGSIGHREEPAPEENKTTEEAVIVETPVKDVVATESIQTEPESERVGGAETHPEPAPERIGETEKEAARNPEPPVPEPAVQTRSDDVEALRSAVESLQAELGKYTTTKEQIKEYSAIVAKRDAETADRKLMGILEQLSVMREDFNKLCKGMRPKLGAFTAEDVLSSFEAYRVDMENMLTDCGVFIGPFKYDRLNTIHQRIVDVIPTDDESMNGKIAGRVTDGYEYGGRVLCKERVNIYKFSKEKELKGEE
ncbi:MAG: hypothetical protein LBT41_01865 [Candidatus Methanoplasma sp.]|jgi:molecular chaperone GrpE (heat shock protein)|nr:hypothetical protein [Candidatus Methanoplasma sp.]